MGDHEEQVRNFSRKKEWLPVQAIKMQYERTPVGVRRFRMRHQFTASGGDHYFSDRQWKDPVIYLT